MLNILACDDGLFIRHVRHRKNKSQITYTFLLNSLFLGFMSQKWEVLSHCASLGQVSESSLLSSTPRYISHRAPLAAAGASSHLPFGCEAGEISRSRRMWEEHHDFNVLPFEAWFSTKKIPGNYFHDYKSLNIHKIAITYQCNAVFFSHLFTGARRFSSHRPYKKG